MPNQTNTDAPSAGTHIPMGENEPAVAALLAKFKALAADFDRPDKAVWESLVAKTLAREPIKSQITDYVHTTMDGITIQPCYGITGQSQRLTFSNAQKRVLSRNDAINLDAVRVCAADSISDGAQGMQLVTHSHPLNFGYGLAEKLNLAALEDLLTGLEAQDDFTLELATEECEDAFSAAGFAVKNAHRFPALSVHLGIDPYSLFLHTGDEALLSQAFLDNLGKQAHDVIQAGFRGAVFACDSRFVHACGGTHAQEVGYVLACAISFMRMLDAVGIRPHEALPRLRFHLAADSDVLLTIAKFRALRLCFANIEALLKLAPSALSLIAETGWRDLSRLDPWSNVLRASLAALGAMLGTADGLCVLPFSLAQGLPDAFARKLALNTALVLREESALDFVNDPLLGSSAIEDLSQQMAKAGWAIMQRLEGAHSDRAKGLAASLEQGLFQDAVCTAQAKLIKAVTTGSKTLVGGNAYVPCAMTDGHVSPSILRNDDGATAPAPSHSATLCPIRLLEEYERTHQRDNKGHSP